MLELLMLLTAAFVPSIAIMLFIRNTERRVREPTSSMLGAFARGATLSIIIAVVIEVLLVYLIFQPGVLQALRVSELLGEHPEISSLILACVIAPFAEEATKALGILPYARKARELEDGLIYGAAVGLGFAATENLLYESSAYFEGGVALFVGTVIVRSVASALLHASASAITGYGMTSKRFLRASVLPYYLLAVLLHAVYNLAASAGPFLEGAGIGDAGYLISLGAAIAIAIGAFSWARHKIRSIEGGKIRG